jgi:hypothetical protein
MLSNPWIPVPQRSCSRGRHLAPGWSPWLRVLGAATSVFSLILAAVAVVPGPRTAPMPVVTALVVTETTIQVTIPPTSMAPSSTTRPTLGEDRFDASGSEIFALAERPIRPGVAPQVAAVEFEATTVVEDAPAEVFESIEFSAIATIDLVGAAGRAETSERALVVRPIPDDPFECHDRADQLPLRGDNGAYDRNLVAQMTHSLFECVASTGGLNDVAASTSGWNAATVWGFENMSQQVAAEAVVVAYCESVAFAPSAIVGDNPWGYGGVFQMGDREMRIYGFPGASKFDPVDNVYSAATYFLSGVRRGHGWGGWGPWAVVNTNYNDEVNDRVKVPVLPRFTSTDPEYKGRRGVELPEWAVDPWSWEVPAFDGCPVTGRAWPSSQPLA